MRFSASVMRSLTVLILLCLGFGASAKMCPNLSGDVVCKRAGRGFSFTDGCNRIRCGANGMALSTLRMCETAETPDDIKKCQELEDKVNSRLLRKQQVKCPELDISIVCKGAPNGFMYNDGCNGIACDGNGFGDTTLMACSEPTNRMEQKACAIKLKRVIKTMNVECPLNKTAICNRHGVNYAFTDGCNKNLCTEGGPAIITRKACPKATADNIACKAAAKATQPKASSRSSPKQMFTCPKLAPKDICTEGRTGFRYNDGCNSVRCVRPGEAITTLRYCETADEENDYCKGVINKVKNSLRDIKVHKECNNATQMCGQDFKDVSYYDGCNYCSCMGPDSAACTRRACHRFMGTKEQFEEECRRRKAGRISRRNE